MVLKGFWGFLGALGGLLEPSWPICAPRANKTSKKVVRWPPFPPLLGAILEPKLDPKLELSWAILIKKVFQNTLGKLLAFKHRFLTKIGLPGPPLDP